VVNYPGNHSVKSEGHFTFYRDSRGFFEHFYGHREMDRTNPVANPNPNPSPSPSPSPNPNPDPNPDPDPDPDPNPNPNPNPNPDPNQVATAMLVQAGLFARSYFSAVAAGERSHIGGLERWGDLGLEALDDAGKASFGAAVSALPTLSLSLSLSLSPTPNLNPACTSSLNPTLTRR
jgi:hypothetical protein